MKFTLNWLKEYLTTTASLREITEALISLGHEVEEVINRTNDLKDFIIVEIIEAKKHYNAEKLNHCKVTDGKEIYEIVCGASNVKIGMKAVFAPVESIIPSTNSIIKSSNIRGVISHGMLCSEKELLVGEDSEKIIELDANVALGKKFVEYIGLDDPVIDITLTPNRGDCTCVYGIARDLAAKGLGKLKLDLNQLISESQDSNIEPDILVEISDKKTCSQFFICQIKSVNNTNKTPRLIAKRLSSVGIKLINPIVDICNYVVHSFGQPIHVYDREKLKKTLTVSYAKSGMSFIALDNKKYKLSNKDIIIGDRDNIFCLAGIIGSIEVACIEKTNDIIIEAAIFNPDDISNSSKSLKIETDAKYRFERRITGYNTKFVLDYTCSLIQEYCGGIKSNNLSIIDKKKPINIDFDYQLIKKLLLLDLEISKVKEILVGLGFIINKISENNINLTVPESRSDITIPEDIIEEIARIIDYNTVPLAPLPCKQAVQISSKNKTNNFYHHLRTVKNIVASLGCHEVVTWSFMPSEKAKFFADAPNDELNDNLKISNPISEDLDYLRPSAIGNLLSIISKNQALSINDLSIFEIGPNFIFDDEEITTLTIILSGSKEVKSLHEKTRGLDIFDIKGYLEYLSGSLGVNFNNFILDYDVAKYYHPSNAARVILGKKLIGYFGEVHPKILKVYDLNMSVFACEILLNNWPFKQKKFSYLNLTSYQLVKRDFAFIISKTQNIGPVLEHIKQVDKELIRDVVIFDIYSGKSLSEDKKSIAISCIIKSDTHTLTTAEIDSLQKKIIENIEQKFSAKLR